MKGVGERTALKQEGGVAYLTAEEMTEADRVTIEEFGVDVPSLMENAGRGVALLARRMLGGNATGRRVCCVVGKGNNGGDGLVAARHLHGWGAEVTVVLSGNRSELRDIPARQLETVDRMGISIAGPEAGFGGATLLIDGLLGYGSRGAPREPVAGLIRRMNASGVATLAVDIPSGLDATTGEPGDPCVVAKATITLGFPKTGFLNPGSRRFVGELYLADISMPRGVYLRYSKEAPQFGEHEVFRIG
jgi:NAD(P)H-hydrate epimerase